MVGGIANFDGSTIDYGITGLAMLCVLHILMSRGYALLLNSGFLYLWRFPLVSVSFDRQKSYSGY